MSLGDITSGPVRYATGANAPRPVTAVDVDALDKLREALAAVLAEIHDDESRPNWTWLADALLPVVDRIANERAAAVLRAAAEQIRALADGPVPAINDPFDAVVILRARADDVDPS